MDNDSYGIYKIYGINPTTQKWELWHDTNTYYGAEIAADSAIEAGWTNVTIV